MLMFWCLEIESAEQKEASHPVSLNTIIKMQIAYHSAQTTLNILTS